MRENNFKNSTMSFSDFEQKLDELLEFYRDYTYCCLDEANGSCSKETYEQISKTYYNAKHELLRLVSDLYDCADETLKRTSDAEFRQSMSRLVYSSELL